MKTPPEYLKEHAVAPTPDGPSTVLADGSWCGHGEPESAIFDIHDAGETKLGILLPSDEPYPALCAVSAFRKGEDPFFIYDARQHPASVFADPSTEYPYNPAAPHQCSCGCELFRIAVGFEIPGDSESPEDASWFAVAVQCSECGVKAGLFDDETA